MTRQVRKVAFVVLALFVALFVNINVVQVVRANEYTERDATRKLQKDFGVRRGSILAADGETEIARVQETGGTLRFQRVYDQGPQYAHITGFLSKVYDRTELERSQDEVLSGQGDVVDNFTDLLAGREPTGDTVVTTIRPEVQQAAIDALGGRAGSIVALDPGTGEVLALWSFPTYDPNELATFNDDEARAVWERLNDDPARPLENRATRRFYNPGSTFKVVTAAAALERGLSPDEEFEDPVRQELPNTQATIGNFGGGLCNGGEPLTLADAIRVSCNTTFAQIAIEIGGVALVDQAEAFGFGTDLGGQMPSIVASEVTALAKEDLDPATAAQSAIGQRDVRVTPLQMASVAGAIGAGGTLYAPHMVRQIEDFGGSVRRDFPPSNVRQAISPRTAGLLRDMMVDVVENGTGTSAQIPGVEVAGKTGTAERGEGRNPNVWFIGFAPAFNPTVAVAVVVEDGGDVGSEATGGAVAAPIGQQVLRAALTER